MADTLIVKKDTEEKEERLRSGNAVIQSMSSKHKISYAIVKAILAEWTAIQYKAITGKRLDEFDS